MATVQAVSGMDVRVTVPLAVGLHKIPEGFTVASVMLASGSSRRAAFGSSALLGGATVVGVLTMSLLWGYFTFVERLTVWYGNAPAEMAVFWETQTGSYAPLFWTMVFCNFVIPLPLLGTNACTAIGAGDFILWTRLALPRKPYSGASSTLHRVLAAQRRAPIR